MGFDSVGNFVQVQASTGYSSSATSVTLQSCQGSRLPVGPQHHLVGFARLAVTQWSVHEALTGLVEPGDASALFQPISRRYYLGWETDLMILTHHDLTTELDDAWWAEAG